jgi:putative transposase
MKTTRSPKAKSYMPSRITKEVKNAEAVWRDLGITKTTFYNWKKRYSGIDGEHLRRLKELEEENRKLKSMYADLALDNKMLKDVLSKKW